MKSPVEKILSYALGGVLGIAFALILNLFNINIIQSVDMSFIILLCMSMGIIISMIFSAYSQHKIHVENTKIKDETVTLITHEMRTSLTSCGWMIGSMLKKYNDKIDKTDAHAMQTLIDSIHTTVMHSVNLLDVSLLEIHKLAISLKFEKLKTLEEMFKEVLEKYTIGTTQHGIILKSNVKLDDDREVEVDLLRLRIVLENLLENAIQYSNKADQKLPTSVIEVNILSKENTLYINVSDQGIGIPKAEQPKIFSQFYRASNARRTLSTGSGIGLYTSAQYIKAHKGTIRFESDENKGTTFFVTIPLKTSADVNEFVRNI